NPPTVFIQPKISSTRLRSRWLVLYPARFVVRASRPGTLTFSLQAACGADAALAAAAHKRALVIVFVRPDRLHGRLVQPAYLLRLRQRDLRFFSGDGIVHRNRRAKPMPVLH